MGLVFELNIIRNLIACCIFFLSIDSIINRKFFRYCIFVFVATLFHSSAVIYLPLYFILTKKVNRKFILIVFLIGNGIFFLQFPIAKTMLRFLVDLFYVRRLSDVISFYLRSETFNTSYGLSIGLIEREFTFLLIFNQEKKLLEKYGEKMRLFINSLYLYIFIFFWLADINIVIDRITIMFYYSYWILYPCVYEKTSRKGRKYLFLCIFFLFGIMKLFVSNNTFDSKYHSLLSNSVMSFEEYRNQWNIYKE